MPKAGHTRDALEQLFHENKLKPQYAMELDSSELLKRFIAADVGVGFIARSNVQEDVQAKVLVAIPMAETPIRRDLALVFRKDKALSRAALAFIDTTVKIKKVDPVAVDPLTRNPPQTTWGRAPRPSRPSKARLGFQSLAPRRD